MPVIPSVQSRPYGLGIAAPQRVQPSPIGGYLRQAGAEIGEAGEYLERRADEDGRIGAAEKQSKIRFKALEELTRAQTSGEDLNGLTDRISQFAESEFATASKDVSPQESRYLNIAKTDLIGDLRLRALGAESEYRVVKRVAQIGDLLEGNANLLATNSGMFAKVYAESSNLIDNTTGLPLAERERLKDGLKRLGRSAVAGKIERDPYGAARELASGQWDRFLDDGDRVSLYNGAQSAVKAKEAEAKQNAAYARTVAAENANIYMAGFEDYAAYISAGNAPDPKLHAKYSPQAIAGLGVKEAGRWAKAASDAYVRGEIMLGLRTADGPQEQAKFLEQALAADDSPENYRFNADTARIASDAVKQFASDLDKAPGNIAAQSSRVQDAIKTGDGPTIVAASVAEQERLGVPANKRVALPESYADSLVAEISMLSPEKQGKAAEKLAVLYGSAWPQVFKQIATKLPDHFAIAATMAPGVGRSMLLQIAGTKKEDRNAGLTPENAEGVRTALTADDTMQKLRASLRPDLQASGSTVYAQAENSVRDLAYQYIATGLSASDAVAKAAEEVNAAHTFVEMNGLMARVPSGERPKDVEKGMDRLVDTFEAGGYDVPVSETNMFGTDAPVFYSDMVQRSGSWVNDADGRGLYLFDGTNFVTIEGERRLWTWEELRSAGAKQ